MPLLEQKLTGLKKRQLIESANKTMFIWVAIASVAVAICLVTAQFFFQQIAYNNRVIGAKQKAVDTLTQNITNANSLKHEIDALVGNQDLASVKLNQTDPNTKSVLDALPSVADPTQFATSLQQSILNRSGVSIESIAVGGTAAAASQPQTAAPAGGPVEQPFTVIVNGSYDKIRNLLLDLERTIRPIKITHLDLSGNDASMRATITAVTYYQPAKKVTITQETVR